MNHVYTVPEVAKMLRIHPRSLYRMIKQERIKVIRFGRNVRISQEGLEEFIGRK